MILIDPMGHMVSDTNEEELHAFAKKLKLERKWFQDSKNHFHYDLTTMRMRHNALVLGARMVKGRELVERAWWNHEEKL